MTESILIMGGSYFIGKSVVKTFLDHGYDVTVLNRGTRDLPFQSVHSLQSDRNDREQMKQTLAGQHFDYIVDVSGLNQLQMDILCDSIDFSQLKKFIFLSSSAVYNLDTLTVPFKETDPVAENSIWTFYGQNKIEAENYLSETLQNKNVDFIALRPPYVYGEDNYAPRESFIFEHIENEKPIILPEEGASKLQFIHRDDLAMIILSLIQKKTTSHMIFNVGNKEAMTIREWIACCEEAVGKKADLIPFDYKAHQRKEREFFPFFDYDNVLDCSSIKTYYDQEIDFIDGLKGAYKWYQAHRDLIQLKESITQNEQAILKLLKK